MIIPRRNERFKAFMSRMADTPECEDMDEKELLVAAMSAYHAVARRVSEGRGIVAQEGGQDPLLVDGNEVYLYGDIGNWWDEVGFDNVRQAVQGLEEVNLRINSPGGDVFEGFLIANYLMRLPVPVNVTIDSMALSIASYIAMVGDRRVMADNARIMIHRAYTIAIGDTTDFAREAEVLAELDNDIAAAYVRRSDYETPEIMEMMTDETWFTSAKALESGFVTDIEEGMRVAAYHDPMSMSPKARRMLFRGTYQPVIKMPSELAGRVSKVQDALNG